MLRKEKFVPDEYYHIYSRIILSIPEFQDNNNANKLAQTFLLANSVESTKAFDYLRTNDNPRFEKAVEIAKQGEKFVDILCYAIMHDHYHLLVKELKENGITSFIRRCNTSISKYINKKTDRRGPLFESRFKSKHIDSNEYLLHLSVYIHLNPLDFISGREWRENKLKDWLVVKEKLLLYPWSSLKHFLYKEQENMIVSGTDIILNQFNNEKEYELFLQEWAELIKDDNFKNILID